MARIGVPEAVYAGFRIIARLTDEQVDKLANYLSSFTVGKKYNEVEDDLTELLNVDGDDLLRTIFSFNRLVREGEFENAELAKHLAESFNDLSRSGLKTKELIKLKANILAILSNYSGIQTNQLIKHYRIENSHNLSDFKLFTDLRIIDEENSGKETYAVVLHKIFMNFNGRKNEKGIHIHADVEMLRLLRDEIEKAIERDTEIKKRFEGTLKLV